MTWIITAASLVGMWLNIRHDRLCFVVWGITNAAWVAIDIDAGIYSQAALQAVYFAASIWGWRSWKTKS